MLLKRREALHEDAQSLLSDSTASCPEERDQGRDRPEVLGPRSEKQVISTQEYFGCHQIQVLVRLRIFIVFFFFFSILAIVCPSLLVVLLSTRTGQLPI